jgi:hypothetical protein
MILVQKLQNAFREGNREVEKLLKKMKDTKDCAKRGVNKNAIFILQNKIILRLSIQTKINTSNHIFWSISISMFCIEESQ